MTDRNEEYPQHPQTKFFDDKNHNIYV